MPIVPAFCDICGAVFPSGIAVENSRHVVFSGNRSGPCPQCGGMGHVPDGVFNFIGNTIEILSAPERTITELTRLAQILRDAKANKESPEQVADHIRQELPTLSKLADLLPRNRSDLYGFLAVVLAAVQLVTQQPSAPQSSVTINISQVVQQVVRQSSEVDKKPTATRQITNPPRRNEPCKCGSGKRYKKCCGALR